VISNWTGRPVFFCTIVARRRTLAPEQISSTRSLTRSHARSLLSIAKLKIARSRLDRAISRRTRIDQTCFGSSGFFWPTSNPLFQGCRRLIGRADMCGAPPSRPPRRSIASVSILLGREPINARADGLPESAAPRIADALLHSNETTRWAISDQVRCNKQKGRLAAALLSGLDQFVRSRGGIPLGSVDSEALRRSEHPGEVLRPVNVDGSGGHPGGPGGMLGILQFQWQRPNKLVIRRFR
jgi:hypothetical protein